VVRIVKAGPSGGKKKKGRKKKEQAARPLLALAGMPLVAHLARSHWKALTLAFLAVLGETAADVAEPWPVKIVIDNVLRHKPLPPRLDAIVQWFPHDAFATLNFALAAVLLIAVVGAVSSYSEKFLTTSVAQWVAHDLRRMVYQRIQRLSLAEHGESRTGDLLTRVTSDIDAVQDFITSALLGIVINILTLAGMLAVMFYMNWRFTLIALSVSPFLFLVVFKYTRLIKKSSREVRKKEGQVVSVIQEVLTSIRVVKAFAREDYEQKRLEEESLESVELSLRARSLKAKLSPMVEIIVAMGTSLVLFFGARMVLTGSLAPGSMIVFIWYLGKMYKPMQELSKMTDSYSKAAVGYERIREVLETDNDLKDMPGARPAPRFKGEIEFENVTFSYEEEQPILKDVSFRIEVGQVAAFVGRTGAGKSSIVGLVPRFYDPTSGVVKIDGVDVRRYTQKSIREQVSFVLQETLLFHAPVWKNIAYGKQNATRSDILQAAERANAAEFIEKMPQRYDTMIGERGVTLSGGQRQRIAIARAMIRDTPILILDEPGTGLDADSENLVFEALERLMKGKTTIVIAHRLSTIQRSDVIFVIEDGSITQSGSHEDLLKNEGLYSELYKLQINSADVLQSS
jgi:ATP-binding cassette, subfamily B, bacterial